SVVELPAGRDRRLSAGMEPFGGGTFGRGHVYLVFGSDRENPCGHGTPESSRNTRRDVGTGAGGSGDGGVFAVGGGLDQRRNRSSDGYLGCDRNHAGLSGAVCRDPLRAAS